MLKVYVLLIVKHYFENYSFHFKLALKLNSLVLMQAINLRRPESFVVSREKCNVCVRSRDSIFYIASSPR